MEKVKTGKVQVDQYNVYYEIHGEGANVVLFIPAALGTITTELTSLINEFKHEKEFTLVAVDLPGFGRSAPPFRDFDDYLRKDAQMLHTLMEKLGFNRYTTGGLCDGGRVALIMAATYPQNVEKVIAWSTSSYLTDGERKHFRDYLIDISTWKDVRTRMMTEIYGDHLPQYWRELVTAFINYEDMFTDDLKSIECPVFILHGDKDIVVNKSHPDFMAKRIRNCKVHRFPDGGHHIHEQFPQRFHELIVDFLRQKCEV